MGVLPDSSLLARRGGQAVLQPEEDEPWQAQQLEGMLDEGLDQDVGHEEGGCLWGRCAQRVDDALGVVQEGCDLIQKGANKQRSKKGSDDL